MTIDEAIKKLSEAGYVGALTYDQLFKDACKLGIEALKAIVIIRDRGQIPPNVLLPGETEE